LLKLSTKGRYGLKAIIDLAVYSNEEAISLSNVADRTGISVRYLEQLISKLKKAGLVSSIRGAQGGYKLAKSANEISVGDILRALEGDLSPVDCISAQNDSAMCADADACVTKLVWKRINDSINQAVDTMMLSELVEATNSIDKNKTIDYKNKNC